MNKCNLLRILLVTLTLHELPLLGQLMESKNAAEIQLALEKLSVLGSALYIAAHPDDENTAVLAYLANEKLVRTAYLSLTRGDGGQNLIGPEKEKPLGIIRTQELLAARQIDGGEQYFSRAIDFGYSKSAEETLTVWGRQKVLADVVWVIRMFRPDVIITRFTPELGGHGHHLASAMLAQEAFSGAADPLKFPEQLSYVEPWQAKRLVWNRFTPNSIEKREIHPYDVTMDVGTLNALLGKSYTELAAESRSMHKCQGFGASPHRGSKLEHFQHVLGEPAEHDLFSGIDVSWERIGDGAEIGKVLDKAAAMFDPRNPSQIIPSLVAAHRLLNELDPDYWVVQKQNEIANIIHRCAGLWIEGIAENFITTPGAELNITATIVNRSGYPVTFKRIRIPFTEADFSINTDLKNNQPYTIRLSAGLPVGLAVSQPYWLREESGTGIYQIGDQSSIGLPDTSPIPPVKFFVLIDGVELDFETPVRYRWTDPIDGERYRPVEVRPVVTVELAENVYFFSNDQPKKIHFSVSSHTDRFDGELHVQVPVGWHSDPKVIPIEIRNIDEELNDSVTIVPPSTPSTGSIGFEIETDGQRSLARSYVGIQYPHIPRQSYFPAGTSTLVRSNIAVERRKIGYIMGTGDDILDTLQQLGYDVSVLTDEEIRESDLGTFGTIITGIRAYNTRECLRLYHSRLLQYVRAGGTLIDQYNVSKGLVVDNLGPYPFTISRDRVTVEHAPVKFLNPGHSLLNTPNKITQQDFAGWIQERGLYFPNQWDARYETIISCHDPGEDAKSGGILYCRYGQGVYIYTGYSWFRQLPAGIPGAYRLFVNLLSAE